MGGYGEELKYDGKWYDNNNTEFKQITVYPKKGFRYDIKIQVPYEICKSEEKVEDFVEWWVSRNLKGVEVWMDCDEEPIEDDEFKITQEEAEKLIKSATIPTIIKPCPHLLPCGFCDKRGGELCSQYTVQMKC